MSPAERRLLRTTFDAVAERYDAVRPRYPDALVAELVELAGIGPGSRIVEIGSGTGQLTVPLAATGADVTAVELGPQLAAVARRNLGGFPRVRVVQDAFERVDLPDGAFDLVVAATSFHWIDEGARFAKPARILRPGGSLAIVETHHISAGGSADFFAASQRCYEAWDPDTPPDLPRTTVAGTPVERPDLVSPLFTAPTLRRHLQDVTYETDEYLQLLCTYSGHLALPDHLRAGLLNCLADLIDGQHGGRVTKQYLFELRVAQRL
ncbi:class I SAM-dependent methyltransferase [Pseudonocardia sp. CA-107938]|uniref:class I SAM-dependent methyltransferase n=1 Tax=Pseudonocardia sp. CA-107938 TaxID=3240021 RepID=UPI003D8C7108